jgi:hypothetical protein
VLPPARAPVPPRPRQIPVARRHADARLAAPRADPRRARRDRRSAP